ncbi:hypothetical protein FQN50_000569 [Emmonsiellopsis sp. PD_5]|nr:hypothetical protein FQN50_000569 [Emmonsiellopsis sp. PD_5]
MNSSRTSSPVVPSSLAVRLDNLPSELILDIVDCLPIPHLYSFIPTARRFHALGITQLHRRAIKYRLKQYRSVIDWAIARGQSSLIRKLLALGETELTRDDYMLSLNHVAYEGNDEIMQILLHAALRALDPSRDVLLSALRFAAEAGHLSTVKILLDAGADPALLALPEVSKYGYSPPKVLARHEMIARELIESGFPISYRDVHGRTALHFAALQGSATIAQLLLDSGIDFPVADAFGQTEICFAATMAVDIRYINFDETAHAGHEAVLKLLIDRGVDLSAADHNGATALHRLCSKTGSIYESMVHTMVRAGADVSPATRDGHTPLYFAAATGSRRMVETLVNAGASTQIASPDGSSVNNLQTPLKVAVEKGHEDVVQFLLETGDDLTLRELADYTGGLLHSACSTPHEGIALLLLDAGADPSWADEDGATILHHAALQGLERLAKASIDLGADVSAQDIDGGTPLFVAAFHGEPTIARLLLDAGAEILASDKDGRTPLHVAVDSRCVPVTELLLNAGAPVSAQDRYGNVPLHVAASGVEAVPLVTLLLHAGADISVTDTEGRTALHQAAETANDKSVVNFLLRSGAKVNAADNGGWTALHYAANGKETVRQGKYSVVLYLDPSTGPEHFAVAQELLWAGADPTSVNKNGETALDMARKKGNQSMIELLGG